MSKKKPKVARLELKPTQVNTGFAQGNFDPRTGVAGYTLNPELAAMRDIFYGGANDYLGNNLENSTLFGQDVSNIGQDRFTQATQYDIPQMAKDWYRGNQALMADDRAQEESRLADTLFKTGATGSAVGMQGGYVNPQQFALLKAREQANAGLSLQSEDRARELRANEINTGLNMYNVGQGLQMSPYSNANSLFGLGTGIEGLGMDTLGLTSQFANNQLATQQALQQNQQAINNAKASSSGGLGGAIAGGLQGFASTGSWWGAGAGAIAGGLGYGQQGAGASSATGSSVGGSLANMWNGSSPSSGMASLFGGTGGWGNANAGTPAGTWTPIDTNIGMGGYHGPANYGGGTLGPTWR